MTAFMFRLLVRLVLPSKHHGEHVAAFALRHSGIISSLGANPLKNPKNRACPWLKSGHIKRITRRRTGII